MNVERVLAQPGSGARQLLSGIDSLRLLEGHVSTALERLALLNPKSAEYHHARQELLRELDRVLSWLPAAHAEGLLQDCSDTDVDQAEEEWLCLETELLNER